MGATLVCGRERRSDLGGLPVTAPRPKTHMIEQCWWHLDRKTWLRTFRMLTKCGKDRMAGGLLRATRDRAKVDCRICLRRSQSEQAG